MKILYYLCGFGAPKIQEKEQILYSNLQILTRNDEVDVYMNIYDNYEPSIPCTINRVQGGMLANMWKWEESFSQYDFILMILDDVSLPIDFDFENLKKFAPQFDIISPSVQNASNQYMQPIIGTQYDVKLVKCLYLELFFYLMTPHTFKRYLTIIDPIDNAGNWGVDLILGTIFKFRLGLYYGASCLHLWHGIYSQEKFDKCYKYIGKFGFFQTKEIEDKYGRADNWEIILR